ncbi:MAG: Scr1 family TA system antitoxin-like transcriptional regulator [Pseudonocardiaceae bacterium]
MEDQEPTIRGRELGEGLARALKDAKLKQTDASRKLRWSQGRVSRLLSGKRGGSEVDVSAFLAIVDVTGAERERLLGICREQSTPGWLQQHGTRLPQQLRTLIDHEDKAVAHSHVQTMLVPGLLQTAEYAHAVISRVANVPAEEVDDRVAARLARQSLFTREHPARFTFYLHEAALRLPVGGPAVMAEQLRHLLHKSTRPYLKLRVIPASHGAHAATAGPFHLMEFATFRPVIYLESATASVFLEKPEQITAYRSILRALAKTALGEEESRELIATLATELAADREDHHDRA